MRTKTIAATAACALLATIPSFAGERELHVVFPEALALPLEIVAARHPELESRGPDRDGIQVFVVPDGFADRIPEYRKTLSALGATLGKVMPPAAEREAARLRQLAASAGGRDALGLIVKYRDLAKRSRARDAQPLDTAELERLGRIAGKALVASRAMYGEAHATRFDAPTDLATASFAAQRLAMDPEVERVEVDTRAEAQLTPNDQYFSLQWNLQSGPGGIRMGPAWDVTTGSSAVTVAVVDTGILFGHPDLAGRILPGYDFISSSLTSNDGDGRDGDATDAGSYGSADACGGTAKNSSWHGTHVAGIIGANGNNGIGVAGIDWRARLLPARALGRCGSGSTSDIIDAIAWSAGLSVPGVPANPNPARIINASLTGKGSCSVYAQVLLDALRRGSLLVAAAGNDNADALQYVPASCALALTVAAVGPTGDKAAYSNYSPALEIAAPGGDGTARIQDEIGSTMATGTQGAYETYDYIYKQGTSQAAPHVAGVAALALAVAPTLTVAQLRDALQYSARDFPAGSRCRVQQDCAYGILDAPSAISSAQTLNGRPTNYSALWWRSSESGWGVNLQQQGDIVFGTWFSYLADQSAMWYVMPSMNRVAGAGDVFSGDIYALTGVPFSQINGQEAKRTIRTAGSASVYFFNDYQAIFVATVDGASLTKLLQIQYFSDAPTCDFTTGSRAGLANYQDLWWNPSESGWGVNLAHQGDIIFATWFTYGNSGAPVWLVADALRRSAPGTYTGNLYITSGLPPQSIDGTASATGVQNVGTMTLAFSDGEHGTMTYKVLDNPAQSKSIVRQVWSSPLSRCR